MVLKGRDIYIGNIKSGATDILKYGEHLKSQEPMTVSEILSHKNNISHLHFPIFD